MGRPGTATIIAQFHRAAERAQSCFPKDSIRKQPQTLRFCARKARLDFPAEVSVPCHSSGRMAFNAAQQSTFTSSAYAPNNNDRRHGSIVVRFTGRYER